MEWHEYRTSKLKMTRIVKDFIWYDEKAKRAISFGDLKKISMKKSDAELQS